MSQTSALLLVLHALRLSSFLPSEKITIRTRLDQQVVDGVSREAQNEQQVKHRVGRVTGWTLTHAGRARHAELLAQEPNSTGARPAVERADTRLGWSGGSAGSAAPVAWRLAVSVSASMLGRFGMARASKKPTLAPKARLDAATTR